MTKVAPRRRASLLTGEEETSKKRQNVGFFEEFFQGFLRSSRGISRGIESTRLKKKINPNESLGRIPAERNRHALLTQTSSKFKV